MASKKEKSPVAVFVYNRPDHTKDLLTSLANCPEASETEVFVFSDGPRRPEDEAKVNLVRAALRQESRFKRFSVFESPVNKGLATSIVAGVSHVLDQHETVIVLEDDLFVSPGFLTFMNASLEFYSDEKRVMHISGWNYPISGDGLGDAYLWRCMDCWGWATWKDRWAHYRRFESEVARSLSMRSRWHFDVGGSGVFWSQLRGNWAGAIETWAIFWYLSIYLRSGLCLNPTVSLVENRGLDGTGQNSIPTRSYDVKADEERVIWEFPRVLAENKTARHRIVRFYRRELMKGIWRRTLRRFGLAGE